jgi:hypothetical protein
MRSTIALSGSYLVSKHLIYGFFLQNPMSTLGMNTIIQERSNDLTVLGGLCETSGSTCVECCFDFFWRLCRERFAKKVALRSQRQLSVRSASVHIRQVLLHVVRWEEVNILDTHWLKDVLLEVVIETQSSDALNKYSSPS